jgi:hypothetical protein
MDDLEIKEKGFSDDGEDITIEKPQAYCLECGEDFEWFMHSCDSSTYDEVYGCKKCDDHCGFCG